MQSLRTYLKEIDNVLPDHVIRVNEEVDWKYEITACITEMEKRKNNPVLYFLRVKGYSIPLLVNLFGHIRRAIFALGDTVLQKGTRLEFYEKWNRLISREVAPLLVETGPVKDICINGEDVDLACLPIPKFYEQDAGRYITGGIVVARDPSNPKLTNLSYVRMQLKGRKKFGISLHSKGHMWHFYQKAKASGMPLDVAVIIGAHPALYLAAAAKTVDEYRIASALLEEPIELVKCETLELFVPAQAEILLEGQIALEEEDEGPFTEYTGYLSDRSTRNLLYVSALTMRRDAIFQAIAPSNFDEHLLLSGLPKQARIHRAMMDFIPSPVLRDINWPVAGTHFICFISLEKEALIPGLAKQVGLMLMGLDPYVKIVAVFDSETDISDIACSLRTMARNCNLRAHSDIEILEGVLCHRLDQSSSREGISSKMIIDATGLEKVSAKTDVLCKDVSGILGIGEIAFPCNGDAVLCVIKVSSKYKDLEDIFSKTFRMGSKLTICVDEDIDIMDAKQILWSIATRFQPANSMTIKGNLGMDTRKPESWKATKGTIPLSAYRSVQRLGSL